MAFTHAQGLVENINHSYSSFRCCKNTSELSALIPPTTHFPTILFNYFRHAHKCFANTPFPRLSIQAQTAIHPLRRAVPASY
ncbi:hypothetical protein BIFGAL_02984 [Bifidobacterium gallicum DSM 20093 = LMG 11596]|uniref:Uncharacterized protein n=1 Tax=Bifidobacterium gallicum DSM 20093 = LMG 11596 TaxID=561180 RepID=D1NT71_9BIFI|nr:hypothetical protein BIFGAL_02984 [Bifidobacterium gallicum DSM 20093 = LMG 11596]